MNDQSSKSGNPMFSDSLMSADDALKFLIDSARVSEHTETTSLDESIGRVLSEDIHSKINVPGFDNSAMDGYTIALDEKNLNSTNQTFSVVDRIAAGSTGNELKKGNAARIFTGAPIPKGANTVVMQEECQASEDGSEITIRRSIDLNEIFAQQAMTF